MERSEAAGTSLDTMLTWKDLQATPRHRWRSVAVQYSTLALHMNDTSVTQMHKRYKCDATCKGTIQLTFANMIREAALETQSTVHLVRKDHSLVTLATRTLISIIGKRYFLLPVAAAASWLQEVQAASLEARLSRP